MLCAPVVRLYLDFADHSTINAAAEGNILLRGEGTLILNEIQSVNATINTVANDQIQANLLVANGDNASISIQNLGGDILVGSIATSGQINMISDQGAIIDSTDDDIIDITYHLNHPVQIFFHRQSVESNCSFLLLCLLQYHPQFQKYRRMSQQERHCPVIQYI